MRRKAAKALVRRVTGLLVLGLMLSAYVIGSAIAQGSASWTLDCKGNGSGLVSWNWLRDGVVISGAGGSATCSGTTLLTGTSARPANANGLGVTLSALLPDDGHTKSPMKAFGSGQVVKVRLSVSVNNEEWSWGCIWPGACFWSHLHLQESVQFSFQG